MQHKAAAFYWQSIKNALNHILFYYSVVSLKRVMFFSLLGK